MISCKEFQSFISDYIDGDVSQFLKAEIEEHLASCNDCSLIVKRTLTIKNYLKNLRKVQASPRFEILLRERLKSELNNVKKFNDKRLFSINSFPVKPAIGALVGVIALISVITIIQNNTSKVESKFNEKNIVSDKVINNKAGQPIAIPPVKVTSQGLNNVNKISSFSQSNNLKSSSIDSTGIKSSLEKNNLKDKVNYVKKKKD
ncbi:hypothetical protein DRQ09_03265 [candidate division KSB1 bacterium]|nr:MAG: hypothetical protein DRQ09_03265 [candidate division KSB1 bacterium]